MTNGEKIKVAFPHYDIEIDEHKGYVRVFYEDFYTTYPLRWWNMEYKEPTTKNDLALIHTEGLDEEIRCTMCTNHMKSDRGCDGSCVVDKDMYKAVMDAIEKRIQPSVTPQEPKIKVLERDEAMRKLGAVDIYQARAWITLLDDLEYLKLKICEVEE